MLKVSIILPVYNAGAYLIPAVKSVLFQTYQDWELIIIDDASTDDALHAIRKINDKRIRIVHNRHNIGLAATLNLGLGLASGDFIARMDQDDICYPERIASQLKVLAEDCSIDLVGVRCLAIDEDNVPVGLLPSALTHDELCSTPWRGIYLPHPTWMGRVEWFRRYQYANPAPYLCEDQELLLRSYSDSKFCILPNVLFAYRIRSKINTSKQFKTRYSVFKMQAGYFFKNKKLLNLSRSFGCYLIRLVSDWLNWVFSIFGFAGFRRYKSKVSCSERNRFQKIFTGLNVG